jgi:hypothetical protein
MDPILPGRELRLGQVGVEEEVQGVEPGAHKPTEEPAGIAPDAPSGAWSLERTHVDQDPGLVHLTGLG